MHGNTAESRNSLLTGSKQQCEVVLNLHFEREQVNPESQDGSSRIQLSYAASTCQVEEAIKMLVE